MHSSSARRYPTAPLDAKYFGKNGGDLGGNGASMFLGGARWQRYHQTKLANAVFTHALATKLSAKGSRVKAICAAPGLAATNLQVSTAGDGGFGMESFVMRFAQSAEDGTMALLTACAGESGSGELWEPPGTTGIPVGGTFEKRGECRVTDPKWTKILWEESEKACGVWPL